MMNYIYILTDHSDGKGYVIEMGFPNTADGRSDAKEEIRLLKDTGAKVKRIVGDMDRAERAIVLANEDTKLRAETDKAEAMEEATDVIKKASLAFDLFLVDPTPHNFNLLVRRMTDYQTALMKVNRATDQCAAQATH